MSTSAPRCVGVAGPRRLVQTVDRSKVAYRAWLEQVRTWIAEAGGICELDLSGAEFGALSPQLFDGTIVHKASFVQSTFDHVQLRRTTFQACDFLGTRFESVRLKACHIQDAWLRDCHWRNCSMPGTRITRSLAEDVLVSGGSLADVILEQVDFSNSRIERSVDLAKATLNDVRFHSCELRDVDLSRASLRHVYVSKDCSIEGMKLAESQAANRVFFESMSEHGRIPAGVQLIPDWRLLPRRLLRLRIRQLRQAARLLWFLWAGRILSRMMINATGVGALVALVFAYAQSAVLGYVVPQYAIYVGLCLTVAIVVFVWPCYESVVASRKRMFYGAGYWPRKVKWTKFVVPE